MKNRVELTREDVFERISHLISSGNLENELFDFYFGDTNIGFMSYEDLLELLKGEGTAELVDGKTPKKPKLIGDEYSSRLSCGNCYHVIYTPITITGEFKPPFCQMCGFKIDWRDKE